jgi:hypothetical protein
MSEQPTPSIPARFTYVQRKEIAGFLPTLADRLLLDCMYQRTLNFSLAELAEIKKQAVNAYRETDSGTRRNSLRLIRDAAHNAIERYELDKAIAATSVIYRFKVVLMESHPPIWRQIEVPECTLDDLHEHIQTAMGWTNSHLHQFIVDDECYGDPELLDDGFYEAEIVDSTDTSLSTLFGKARRGTRFRYQYDFGDGWEHDVTFEGRFATEPGVKYPRCVDGERACPPEDVGGVWGYADFLEAISHPKHESHEDMLEWIGDGFDPNKFSPAVATRAMRRGVPNWRDYS